MKYETIMAMPDSRAKYYKLLIKLLKPQVKGGPVWKAAVKEWERLYPIYGKD